MCSIAHGDRERGDLRGAVPRLQCEQLGQQGEGGFGRQVGIINIEVNIDSYPRGFSFEVEANTDVEIVLPADVKSAMENLGTL